jgi:hypothetical protein
VRDRFDRRVASEAQQQDLCGHIGCGDRDGSGQMKADGGRSSCSTSRKGTLKQGGVSGEYTETQGG